MTPSGIRAKIVTQRARWLRQMLAAIQALPLDDFDSFSADPRNPAAAESYLRRALEALLDLGRHILAKGFAEPADEYKAIAVGLAKHGLLDASQADLLRELAGYRNRMVHFYNEIGERELFEICRDQLADIESLLTALLEWLRAHPQQVDESL